MVQQGSIPEYDNFFDQEEENKGYWHGFEILDVIIHEERVNLPEDGDELLNFFVKVYPFIDPLALANISNSTNLAYKFNIAFYDEDQYIMLKDGYP